MNYYFNNAMRLEGDLMSRGKEVKELREKMGMNRREFSDYYGILNLLSNESQREASNENRKSRD